MSDQDCFHDTLARAAFDARAMRKLDCFRTDRLFVGLNCLKRAQTQRRHTHEGTDKFYLVLTGKARITVGGESRVLETGGLALAPAGRPHGIDEALEDSVLLVTMAPPPEGDETTALTRQSEQSPRG